MSLSGLTRCAGDQETAETSASWPESHHRTSLPPGKVSTSSPHLQLPAYMRKRCEGCTSYTLLLRSYNNIRNNKHHFNIDKWLQTTEGAPGRNILKEPGTRKLYFLESNSGQKAFSPGRLKHVP